MTESVKQAKQAQKEFLDVLKAFPTKDSAVDMCEVYKSGYDAGKIVGKNQQQ